MVFDEPFRCEFGPVQIAAPESRAADMHLAGHANRHRFAVRIEDINLQVGDRHADHAPARDVAFRERTMRDMHRRLGDPIHVHELRRLVAMTLEPRLQAPHFQSLAPEDHVTQRERLRAHGFLRRHQHPKRGRRLVQHRDALAHEQFVKTLRRPADGVRHHDETPAVEQRAPDFPDGKIERDRVKHRPDIALVEAEPVPGGREQPHDIAVCDERSLRLAGRARCVNHVCEMIRPCGRLWIFPVGGGSRIAQQFIDADHFRSGLRQIRFLRAVREQHRRPRIAEHECDALRRIREVDRQICAAGFQDAEQSGDQLVRALHADADKRVRSDTRRAQPPRDAVRAGVQFAIRERFSVARDSRRVR